MISTKTVFKSICLVVFISATSLSVFSQEKPSPAMVAAGKMVDSMNMEKTLKDTMESTLDTQMGQFSKMGMSAEGVAELKDAMLKFMLDAMSWKDLRPEFVKIYSENFTAEELNEIAKFNQTPTGKKVLDLTPKLTAQGMALGQQRVTDRQAELQAIITPIMQKHLGQ